MPKLMKGATPNELVKGVTANLTIASGLEPASNANSYSKTQCYRFHIFVHSITKWTGSSLENRSSQHRGYC
ncbi:hypothetical protein T4A_5036 [Trichinella pseudospiralis]|uniref:Uncharacterized protein n=1 Tax=Trichinella pseudospiralis TaxID=6337 RepID=A0A0V1E5V3_TRIPS|nr:hypothetical protein T4A_5036 [Trichinella pseudospiralis]